jgi:GDPmannose 4,6-dehydratase
MKALITGITGQDGAYLADLLLDKGYEVFGAYRRSSSRNFWRLKELSILDHPNLTLVEHDLADLSSNIRLIDSIQPQEIYNLAAQSFVGSSFSQPILTTYVNSIGTLNILEAIRILDIKIKFYQASTSEMFGKVLEIPQNESTPFYPRSPYGISKLYSHWMTVNYRESFNIFAVSGILFNHESPLRGLEFVTRKITDGFAKISLKKLDTLELGNLDAKRDWGFAKDYVEGMWKMLQADIPKDYILATGRTESVRNFVNIAAKTVNLNLTWEGSGVNEKAIEASTGKVLVKINESFYRKSEVDLLIGSSEKAQKELNWKPKTSLEDICKLMIESDIRRNLQNLSF